MNRCFVIVTALLILSSMWPSEGAVNGDGLPWALLWMLAAVGGHWLCRDDNGNLVTCGSRRNKLARFAPVIIVLGVWLSTFYVFRIQADRRAALNLAFEWTGVLAAATLCWRFPVISFRQQVGRVVIGLAAGAALMSVLQHHVVWEQRSEWYLERVAAIERWLQTGTGAIEAQNAKAELLAEQVPLEGSEAETFRRRLLDSSEPVGPFALANTLGGFLAAGLVLLVGGIWNSRRQWASERSRASILTSLLPVCFALLMGYALVLTKSRTAWVAAAIGVVFFVLQQRHKPSEAEARSGRLTKPLLALLGVGGCLLAVGILVGAIDREVLLESPRSLRFRLMYWIGTLDVLQDQWLWGTGPGNFRNAYLLHKMPEASEQIVDPHNIVLDTYCNAGLIGLIGLVLLLVTSLGGRRETARVQDAECGSKRTGPGNLGFKSLVIGAVLATVLFIFESWFNGQDLLQILIALPDSPLLVLCMPLGVVLLSLAGGRLVVCRDAFEAAMLATVIHLLGAGAFQITLVGLTLVVLHRGACGLKNLATESANSASTGQDVSAAAERALSISNGERAHDWDNWWSGGIAISFSLMAAAVIIVGILPFYSSKRALAESRVAEMTGRRVLAVEAIRKAVKDDPYHVKLRQRKAELLAYQYLSERDSGVLAAPGERIELESVLKACDEWAKVDSTGFRHFAVESQLHESVWSATNSVQELEFAIAAMKETVQRYPTNSEYLSRLAILQAERGWQEQASDSATAALRQDQLNRDWGHAELFLDDPTSLQLREMLEE